MLLGENAAVEPRADPRPAIPVTPRPHRTAHGSECALLAGLAAIVGSVVLSYGGMSRPEFESSLAALGLFAIGFWMLRPARVRAPALGWGWLAPLAGFPLLVMLQLVPLPIGLVEAVSPARAGLATATSPFLGDSRFVPLSVEPGTTFAHLARLLSYVTVFLVVRELGWSLAARRWLLALPVIAFALAEAGLALFQWTAGAGQVQPNGTYVNPNHLAGLLGLAAPLAVAMAFAAWPPEEDGRNRPRRDLAFAGALGAAAVIATGVALSLSRMGLLSAAAGVCATAGILLNRRRISWTLQTKAAPVLLTIAVLAIAIYLPPDKLISRFGYLTAGNGIAAHSRLPLWRDTAQLIREYPLMGVGLGTFEAPFLKQKTSDPMLLDQYAHNDYLQVLAETGVIGFMLLCWALVTALRSCWPRRPPTQIDAALSAGAFGAVTAIALHSLTDFNLSIPANATIVAWIGGIAASLQDTSSKGAKFDATPPASRLALHLPLHWAWRR